MKRVEVAPELFIDEEMYGKAVEGLGNRAIQLAEPLTWERFTDHDTWLRIPDAQHPDESFYKAEAQLALDPSMLVDGDEKSRTVKINLWRTPDLRGDGAPNPHSHPWPFTADVLMGGYDDDQYFIVNGGIEVETHQHEAGGQNKIALPTFHEVTTINDPDRTMTLMDCGPRTAQWGYLNPDTAAFTPNTPDPAFMELLVDRNPQLRG